MQMREGLLSYIRSLVSVLDSHHRLEDELAFPYLKEAFPDGPYELLMGQHLELAPVLAEIKSALDNSAEIPDSGLFRMLQPLLQKISEFWHPHIRIEEEFLTVEKARAGIALEDHARLGKLFMKHSQQNSGPDFLILPFLLHNLPPDQRSNFAALMPPIVTEQLVPVVWKDKWEPMKPFLLP